MPARRDAPKRAALPILWAFGVAASVLLSAGCGEDGPIPPKPAEGGAAGAGGIAGAGGAVGGTGGSATGGSGGSATGGGTSGGAGGAGGMSMGGAGGTGGMMAKMVPDFSLIDVNPNSMTSGQPVSPRDYLMRVSAWYFGHST
jgi:hypothetical protein